MSTSTPNTPEVWESLLEVVRETEQDLTGVAPFRDTLADAHTRVLMLKTARDAQNAAAAESRRQYREALRAGQDAAVALRGFVQSVLGLRNEKLRCYGIQPRGRNGGSHRKPVASASTSRKKAERRPR